LNAKVGGFGRGGRFYPEEKEKCDQGSIMVEGELEGAVGRIR